MAQRSSGAECLPENSGVGAAGTRAQEISGVLSPQGKVGHPRKKVNSPSPDFC